LKTLRTRTFFVYIFYIRFVNLFILNIKIFTMTKKYNEVRKICTHTIFLK